MIAPVVEIASTIGTELKFVPVMVIDVASLVMVSGEIEEMVGY
jgi:hypothetical protein